MKRTIRDLKNIKGKRILLRCDFNVPLDRYGDIINDNRIFQALPTIKYLTDQGARVIVCSHLGRPKGYDKYLSLFPVAVYLMKCFPNKVKFIGKVVGKEVEAAANALKDGEILVLENLRFDEREKKNDPKFVEELGKLAHIYVNDAFGASHRKHASTYGVALKKPNAVGLLIEKELAAFDKAFKSPAHPFVMIIGGGKVDDKLALLDFVVDIADTILIGGGMAYTFLQAQGKCVGDSIVSFDLVDEAEAILKKAEKKGVKIVLPVDHLALNEKGRLVKVDELKKGMKALDIGKKTIKLFEDEIAKAKQIMWNGPLGMYEDDRFRKGTLKIAKAVAKSPAYTVVGGGDSVAVVQACGLADKFDHVSTGGGASLQLMEGKQLPAIEAIDTL